MSNATKQIIQVLNETLAALDAQMVINQKEWANGRKAALREFKDSAEVEARRMEKNFSWWYYPKMFNICGGKTWYKILSGCNYEQFIEKNCRAIADKRNATIASKLDAVGITEIKSSEVNRTSDGFNGSFVVETAQGKRTIVINTIYAGGYNIQCYHQRTLVKVR